MDRRHLIAALACLPVAGCGGRALTWEGQARPAPVPAQGVYTVRGGDTLYSIAFRYGLDYRALARWNGLGDASLIHPGQRLRLTAPPSSASRPNRSSASPARAASTVTAWRWPTEGRVVARFDLAAQVPRTGILIGGRRGQPVLASASGEIVYSGSGLKGYGKLVIVQHDARYLSAYGHNAALLVAEGERVKAGQRIATMGETSSQRPRLHFEIRRDGQPVDPMPLLGGR